MRIAPAVVIAVILGLCMVSACEAAADLSRDMERLGRLREAIDVQADRFTMAYLIVSLGQDAVAGQGPYVPTASAVWR